MKKLGVIFDLSSLVLAKKCVSVTLNTPELSRGGCGSVMFQILEWMIMYS